MVRVVNIRLSCVHPNMQWCTHSTKVLVFSPSDEPLWQGGDAAIGNGMIRTNGIKPGQP